LTKVRRKGPKRATFGPAQATTLISRRVAGFFLISKFGLVFPPVGAGWVWMFSLFSFSIAIDFSFQEKTGSPQAIRLCIPSLSRNNALFSVTAA
jgi:hypothetical protein